MLKRKLWLAQTELDAVRSAAPDSRVAASPVAMPPELPLQSSHRTPVPMMVEPPQYCSSPAFPNLGTTTTVADLQRAIAFPGVHSNRTRRIADAFKMVPVSTDAFSFNYTDSSALNFTADRRILPFAVSRAALRRECRGLVVHRTGAVLVRPLHRFFAIGQTAQTQIGRLAGIVSGVVTLKLDGQMVCGVVVGGMVQLWTRAGPTPVGVEAFRVAVAAQADYSGFVEFASEQQSTPIFEYVGKRSHKKAYEGCFHKLVLLAVRFHASGEYWLDEDMRSVAAGFGVPVVQRLHHLEGVEIQDLQNIVAPWHNCEGVVTRLADGTWLKVKSDWWKKTGYSRAGLSLAG